MKLGILGHGVVGSGVTSILNNLKNEEIEVKRILVKDEIEVINDKMTTNYQDIFNDEEIDTIVECMGGLEPAHKFAVEALTSKRNFITSNKKMFATFAKELFDLAKDNNVELMFEASVGGGIPWIDNINRVRSIDEISEIEGIFNGTTNYILTRMTNEGISFEEALRNAQELGYAEFDPTDDIDGYDVMYKIMISTIVSSDALINLEDITRFGIRNIDSKDIIYAKDNDYVIKLIGTSKKVDDKVVAYVIPKLIKKNNLFANINMNDNALSLVSTTLGRASFVGQGAGSLPTAHAVVQNIFDVKNKQAKMIELKEIEVDNSLEIKKFYIRSNDINLYESAVDSKIDDNSIITKNISLKELEDITKEDKEVFVMEVSDD